MNNKQTTEQRIADLERRVALLENKPKGSVPSVNPRKLVSEKEYLLEKKPGSAVEKTLLLGAYLERHKKAESFTVEDLRNAFGAARESVPANINDTINKNIKKGFFMEGPVRDGRKTWMLTATGEKTANDDGGDH